MADLMAAAALAPTTLSRYHSAGRLLENWLLASSGPRRLRHPLSVGCFRRFLVDLWDAGYAYATANAARSWVAWVFRSAGKVPPTDDWRVRQQLMGYRKWAVSRTHHRSALTADRLALLFAWMSARPALCGSRLLEMIAFLRAAYCFLARGGELAAARVGDLRRRGDGSTTLFVASSKTDQLARGVEVTSRDPSLGPALLALVAGRPPSARLFRVSPAAVNAVLRLATRSMRWPGWFTVHSCRHGAATDMRRAGRPYEEICAAGRWRSTATVRLYLHCL
jgi:integrase